MKYLKAHKVLPPEMIELIQQFVDGQFLYIPRKNGEKKSWGENSGTKNALKDRNALIYMEYKNGISVTRLSESYFLSEQSIRRIISQEKQRCSSSLHNYV